MPLIINHKWQVMKYWHTNTSDTQDIKHAYDKLCDPYQLRHVNWCTYVNYILHNNRKLTYTRLHSSFINSAITNTADDSDIKLKLPYLFIT